AKRVLFFITSELCRAHLVSISTAARVAIPLTTILPNITRWGAVSVLSRPTSKCHWTSQLVPSRNSTAPNRVIHPNVMRSTHTDRNESAVLDDLTSAIAFAIYPSYFSLL